MPFDAEGYSISRRAVHGEEGEFGATRTVTIPADGADALNSVVLEFELPSLTPQRADEDVRWTPYVGSVMIDQVSLLIGDVPITQQTGQFMVLYGDAEKEKLGDRNFLDRQEQGLTTWSPHVAGGTVYVPLTFWFCEAVRDSLPLFRLRNPVRFQIRFRPFSQLWQSRRTLGGGPGLASKIKRTVPGSPPLLGSAKFRIRAHCDFVVLSDENREWFAAQNPLLIRSTVARTFPLDGSTGYPNVTISLEDEVNPCQKMIWFIQSVANQQRNEWFNFSSRSYAYDDVVEDVTLVDPYVESPGPPLSITVSDRVVEALQRALVVTVGPKTVRNATYGTGLVTCLYVDGDEAPELHLPRSKEGHPVSYAFSGHPVHVYADAAHTVAFAGFASGVLTIGPSTPATLHYTQERHDGLPDATGGNVLHTTLTPPSAVVAPTEETMLVDESLMSATATSYTWPYGPHQLTLFEASGVKEMQMPDQMIQETSSVFEWLRPFIANAKDQDAAAYAHWDSIDAMVTLGVDSTGDMALRRASGEMLYVMDGIFQGYVLGVALLFRGNEMLRLDLRHYYDQATLPTLSNETSRIDDILEVGYTVHNNFVQYTGIFEFDEEVVALRREHENDDFAFVDAVVAMSGRRFSRVFYQEMEFSGSSSGGLSLEGGLGASHVNAAGPQRSWSPYDGLYEFATLRVYSDAGMLLRIAFELHAGATTLPLFTFADTERSTFMFRWATGGGLIQFETFEESHTVPTIGFITRQGQAPPPDTINLSYDLTGFMYQLEDVRGFFVLGYAGEDPYGEWLPFDKWKELYDIDLVVSLFRVSLVEGDTVYADVVRGTGTEGTVFPLYLSFKNSANPFHPDPVDRWPFSATHEGHADVTSVHKRGTLHSLIPEFNRKPFVVATAPPKPLSDFLPINWTRVDSAVYFRGTDGVDDSGSYLLLTNGDRVLRARAVLGTEPYPVNSKVQVSGHAGSIGTVTFVLESGVRYEVDIDGAAREVAFADIAYFGGEQASATRTDLSWTFDELPRPQHSLTESGKWARNPTVINVRLGFDSTRRYTGVPDSLDLGYLDNSQDMSLTSIFALQNGEWIPRASLPIVQGTVYQFVPVPDYDVIGVNDLLFTHLQQGATGGTFRSEHDINLNTMSHVNQLELHQGIITPGAHFHVRMHDQPTINSMLVQLDAMGLYPRRTGAGPFWDFLWDEVKDTVNEDPVYDSKGVITNSWTSDLQYSQIVVTSKKAVPPKYETKDEGIVDEPFPVDTPVRGLFHNGLWYDAVIFRVVEEGLEYEIRWDDGDTRERFKNVDQLSYRDGTQPVKLTSYFEYTYTGTIERHALKLDTGDDFPGNKGGYTSFPTQETVGFLKMSGIDTAWSGPKSKDGWGRGLHIYTTPALDVSFGERVGSYVLSDTEQTSTSTIEFQPVPVDTIASDFARGRIFLDNMDTEAVSSVVIHKTLRTPSNEDALYSTVEDTSDEWYVPDHLDYGIIPKFVYRLLPDLPLRNTNPDGATMHAILQDLPNMHKVIYVVNSTMNMRVEGSVVRLFAELLVETEPGNEAYEMHYVPGWWFENPNFTDSTSSFTLGPHDMRTGVDFHTQVVGDDIVSLHYDLENASVRSRKGGVINVRPTAGTGQEFRLDECFVGVEGSGPLHTLMDKGQTSVESVVATGVEGVVAFTTSDGLTVPAVRATYGVDVFENDFVGSKRHRVLAVEGSTAVYKLPGTVVPDIAYRDTFTPLTLRSENDLLSNMGRFGVTDHSAWSTFVAALMERAVFDEGLPDAAPLEEHTETSGWVTGGYRHGNVTRFVRESMIADIPDWVVQKFFDIRAAWEAAVAAGDDGERLRRQFQAEQMERDWKKPKRWRLRDKRLIPGYGVQLYDHQGREIFFDAEGKATYDASGARLTPDINAPSRIEPWRDAIVLSDVEALDLDLFTGGSPEAYLYASYYFFTGTVGSDLFQFPLTIPPPPATLASLLNRDTVVMPAPLPPSLTLGQEKTFVAGHQTLYARYHDFFAIVTRTVGSDGALTHHVGTNVFMPGETYYFHNPYHDTHPMTIGMRNETGEAVYPSRQSIMFDIPTSDVDEFWYTFSTNEGTIPLGTTSPSYASPVVAVPIGTELTLQGYPSDVSLKTIVRAVPGLQYTLERLALVPDRKDIMLQDRSLDDDDYVEGTDKPPVGSLRVKTVVRMGDTYMFGQQPGDAPFEAQGVRYTLADGTEVDKEAFAESGGYAVWTATPDNVPCEWRYGDKSNTFWLGSNAYQKNYDVRATIFEPNVDPEQPHRIIQRRLDSALVLPNFYDGKQRGYLFRGLYAMTLDYFASQVRGTWVGNASASQQISALLPLVQTGLHMGLPKRIQAAAYSLDQSFAAMTFAPGTENRLWTDATTSNNDRIAMLAQDRTGGATDLQNKLRHLTYRVAASTRNWRELETALNRNVQVMERNHDQSWALFESTNRYLNEAVADVWGEISELGKRLGEAEQRRDPYPYAYNAEREQWYVQDGGEQHLMRQARLTRAPDTEIVDWQDWRYFYFLQNYRSGSHLNQQVYSHTFTTRKTSTGSVKQDAEDFKSAKLSLMLRLNTDRVDLDANLCSLAVYLQVFQNLTIDARGNVSKACEYDAATGKWVCPGQATTRLEPARAVRDVQEPIRDAVVRDVKWQRPVVQDQGPRSTTSTHLQELERQHAAFMDRYRARSGSRVQQLFGRR